MIFATFVVIGLLLNLGGLIMGIFAFTSPIWQEMAQPGGRFYSSWFTTQFAFEMLSLVIATVLAVITLAKFATRSRSFPFWAALLLVFSVAVTTIDILASQSVLGEMKQSLSETRNLDVNTQIRLGRELTVSAASWLRLILMLCGAMLWFIYIRSSERVKSLFVE